MARSKQKKKPNQKKRFKWLTISTVAFFAIVSIAASITLVAILPDTPDPDSLWKQQGSPSVTILDRYGELVMHRGARYGTVVPLDEIPKHLIDAFLATEDRRFFEHHGIDFRGLGRALVANLRANRFVQGGSTITQQLAKNLFLTPERTILRKVQEMSLAMWIEATLSKDEILTLYLNRVYLGAGTYGVEAASQFYFGKSVHDVTVAEAALLAGLPQAPSRYAPTSNLNLAHRRAKLVLDNLVASGFMSHGDVYAARVQPAKLARVEASGAANYFVDWVTERLSEHIGRPDKNLIVKTTYDPKLQVKAEIALSTLLASQGEKSDVGQGALVSFDATGAVRTMVGGRSYKESQFNRASQAKRQPGSAFKPIVYLTALESGMSPWTPVYDGPLVVDKWQPRNYSGRYVGNTTMSNALARSINTVAVRVSEEVGRYRVIDTARRLGINSDLAPNPSIALGTFEVSLLEITSAYIPFANAGQGAQAHGVLEVKTSDGDVIYQHQPLPQENVVAERIATNMTQMLHQVMVSGTGRAARLNDRPAAGKTGTSQDFRDAWFIGYTPDLITGVWVGNDDGSPMNRVSGGGIPARIWKDYMDRAHSGLPVAELPGAYTELADVSGGYSTANQNGAPVQDYLNSLSNRLDRISRSTPRREPDRSGPSWWPF